MKGNALEDEDIEVEADEAVRIVLELARSAVSEDPTERARQEKAIAFIEDYCDSLL